MTNEEIIQRGQLINDETEPAQNTSERVGGVIKGIGQNLADKDAAIAAEAARNGYYQCTVNSNQLAVTAPGFTLPAHGGNIRIKMSAPATGACTLNINSTGPKTLLYNGADLSSTNTWEKDEIISVFYDPSGSGQYLASNSQGGGGKAEKIKYDNSESGLASDNVQGALDEIISEIKGESEVDLEDAIVVDNKVISTVSPYPWTTSTGRKSALIPISPNKKYRIHCDTNSPTGFRVTILKNSSTSGNAAFATGWNSNLPFVYAGDNMEFTAPSDGYYIYANFVTSTGTAVYSVYEYDDIKGDVQKNANDISNIQTTVDTIEETVEDLVMSNAKTTTIENPGGETKRDLYIKGTDNIAYTGYTSASVDVEDYRLNNVLISNTSDANYYYSFLTEDIVLGEIAEYAKGYSGLIQVAAGGIAVVSVPSNAKYLYLSINKPIYPDVVIGVNVEILENPGGVDKRNIYINSDGEVASGYTSASVFIGKYKPAIITIRNTGVNKGYYYAFLKEDISIGSTVSFADGCTLQSVAYNATQNIEVPDDAVYLYLSKNSTTYPNILINMINSVDDLKRRVSYLAEKQMSLEKIKCPLSEGVSGAGTASSPYTSANGTAGISEALKSSTGKKTVIPSGVYNITSQIVIPGRNINIEGDVWNYPQDPNGVHPSDTGTKLSLVSNQIESIFKTQSDMSGMRMSQIGFQGLATTWDYDNVDGNISEYYFNPSSIKNVGLYIGTGRFDQVSLHRLSFSGLAVGILAKYTIDANVWSEINTDGCDFGIFVDYTTCHHPKILNNITSDCVAAGIYYKTTIGQNSYGAVVDGNVLVRNASYLTAAQIAANIPQASLVLIGHSYASVSNNTIILSGVYKRRAGGENYTAYSGGIGLYLTGNYNAIRGNRIAWSTQKAAYINGNYNSITNNIVDDDHDGFEVVGNYNVISDNVFDSALTVTGNGNKVEGNVYTGNIVVSGNNNVISGDKAALITVSGSGNRLIGFNSANITDNGTNTVIE